MNIAILGLCTLSFAPPDADASKESVSDTESASVSAAESESARAAPTAGVSAGPDAAATDPGADEDPDEETVESTVDEQPAGPPEGADPDAPLPKPGPPPEGVAAVGGGTQAPLPAPLPPVDPSTIAKGPWRGTGWIALRLTVGGPLGGPEYPSGSRVVAFGGAGEVGWRISNLLGVAIGLARRPHDQATRTVVDPSNDLEYRVVENGSITQLDFAIARVHWPLDGRLQPYVDAGGGMAIVEPPDPNEPVILGGSIRGSLGFDAWVARTVTLGAGTQYRANLYGGGTGHHLGGYFELGLHW
jgi:hypothetical protein